MLYIAGAGIVFLLINFSICVSLKKRVDFVNDYLIICDEKLSKKQRTLNEMVRKLKKLEFISNIALAQYEGLIQTSPNHNKETIN